MRVSAVLISFAAAWLSVAIADPTDVSGVPNWKQVEPGLYSAGQPAPADWPKVAASGVKAVVNLRGPDEQPGVDEAALARAQGLDYYAFPVASPDDFSAEHVAEFSALIAQLRPGGVLVHCGSGNRVGAMFALSRAREPGVTAEQALAYGRSAGLTGLEPQIAQQLKGAERLKGAGF